MQHTYSVKPFLPLKLGLDSHKEQIFDSSDMFKHTFTDWRAVTGENPTISGTIFKSNIGCLFMFYFTERPGMAMLNVQIFLHMNV